MKASEFFKLPMRPSKQRAVRTLARTYGRMRGVSLKQSIPIAERLPHFRQAERWDGKRWLSPLSSTVIAD